MSIALNHAICQSRAEILAKIKRIIIDNLNLDLGEDQIDDDSPLFGTGLGLDSIDALDLVVGIEEGFSIKVGEDELYVFKSVNALVDYIIDRNKSDSQVDIRQRLGMEEREFDTLGVMDGGHLEVYKALRTSSILYEKPYTILQFPDGEDTLSALGTVLSGKLHALEPNRVLHTALLEEDGRIVDLVYVFQFEAHYWVCATQGNARALEILRDLPIEADDISADHRCAVLEGPYSWAVAKDVFGFEVLGLSYHRFVELEVGGVATTLVRLSTSGEYGYRAFIPAAKWDAVLEEIRSNAEGRLLEVGDQESLREIALVAGTEMRAPIAGVTVANGSRLAENELLWMIDFSNAEMAGRRGDLGKKIVGVVVGGGGPGDPLPSGAEIVLGGATIGRILYTLYSPGVEAQIGYAAMDLAFGYAGLESLEVAGFPGTVVTTVSTPFMLPSSSRVQIQ